eukprot:3606781-Amphidinium_carterae.1
MHPQGAAAVEKQSQHQGGGVGCAAGALGRGHANAAKFSRTKHPKPSGMRWHAPLPIPRRWLRLHDS